MPGRVTLPRRFELIRRLGRGGMGVVYEVFDRERDTAVALKSVRHMHADALLRFKDEFRGARDIKHPNLVELGELLEHDGSWYYTMELVPGQDFIDHVRACRAARSELDSSNGGPPSTAPGETAATRPAKILRGNASARHRNSRCPDYPLAEPPVDMARLRAALAQLATGLAALHRAGKLHCDIKPSNVMVDDSGRVVILDFGLSVRSGETYDQHRAGGTVPYMAPEQADTAPLTAAADWYAVGVMIFEALTGRLPFDDASRADLLARKRAMVAPRLESFVDGAPPDLASLANGLLARRAADRPDETSVLRTLHADAPDEWAEAAPAATGPTERFVGREPELALLHRAFDDAVAGACIAVFVEGASGVGKSATVDELLRQLAARAPEAVVLRGRCHEKEAVPYKALDGVIDRLTDVLVHMDVARRIELEGDARAVAPLFGALRAIEPAGELPVAEEEAAPADRRQRGFEALRTLLTRIARERPLVTAIDDIQWTDKESLALLAELCRAPSAVPMLLIACARQSPDDPPCAAAKIAGADVRRVGLTELDERDARALIAQLAGKALDADGILAETAGHPMFIEELVHHACDERAGATLDDALRARASRLPDDSRALLDAVVTVGVPIAQSVVAAAARLPPDRLSSATSTLRAARLIRIHGTRPRDLVEPFHDRVREAMQSAFDDAPRADLHLRLADELESAGQPAELIAHHLMRAGLPHRSARLSEAAARDALASLAFERAAALFETAIGTGTYTAGERRSLLTALGEALSLAGHPAASARAYMDAARGEPSDAERRELLRRAAEQFLTGGHLEPGLEATRELLRPFGLSLPATRAGAIGGLLFRQTQLDWSRLRWTPRRDKELRDEARARMDVHWSVGVGLGLVDSVNGALFLTRNAILCLRRGDEMRIARGLAAVSVAHAGLGRERHATRLIEACGRAAHADGSPLAQFYYHFARAGYAFLANNDWHGCLEETGAAARLWKQAGRRGGYEADVVDQLECWSLVDLGRIRQVRDRVSARIRAAQRTGNRFIEVSYRTFFTEVMLAEDRVDDARRDVQDAIDSWLPGQTDFGNQHYLALRSLTHISLYAGDVDEHADVLARRWRDFFRSLMRHASLLRADGLGQSGALHLARAIRARQRGERSQARRLARRTRLAARRLGRMRIPWAEDDRLRLEAGLAAYEGDQEACARALRAGLSRAEDRHMPRNAACFRYRLGHLLGGSEGEALIAAADAWAEREGIANMARYADALIPPVC